MMIKTTAHYEGCAMSTKEHYYFNLFVHCPFLAASTKFELCTASICSSNQSSREKNNTDRYCLNMPRIVEGDV